MTVWTTAGLVAGVLAGLAVLLVRPGPPGSWHPASARPTGSAAAPWLVAVPVLAAGLAAWLAPGQVVLALILGAATAAGVGLVRSRRRRVAAERTAERVLEACEHLAGELAAGHATGVALARVAADWPVLAPVAAAAGVGADVPEAWRGVARTPGAADLRLVGAAWHVAHRTGAALSGTLDQVTDDLRALAATRRTVSGELASSRATARLMAALPVAALVVGSGSGTDPWGFLLATPVGLACLGLGLAFGAAGLAWIEALARAAAR